MFPVWGFIPALEERNKKIVSSVAGLRYTLYLMPVSTIIYSSDNNM